MKLRFWTVLVLCCLFGLTPAFASRAFFNSGFYSVGTIHFALLPVTYPLELVLNGTGTGSVLSSPAGINCPKKACLANFTENTIVTLTATPDAGSSFISWNGLAGCKDNILTCDVTMNAAQSSKITFDTTPIPTFALNIGKIGTGTGIVSSNPAGIDCGAICSNNFNQNTVVTLTATPSSRTSFDGWRGACTGTGTCTVTMDAVKNVTAIFTFVTFTLNIAKSGTGAGTVSSLSSGINCGLLCSYNGFFGGALIDLTATPSPGSSFTGWSGACTGTGTCTVTMDADRSVTANFDVPPATQPLSLVLNGTGTGSVLSNPAGIDCPKGNCSANFLDKTFVTLTATPSAGSSFVSWNGLAGCDDNFLSCIVTMDVAQSGKITFDTALIPTFALNITKVGAGTISSNPAGIDCGVTCSNSFNQNTVVTLTATPASGSSFTGWTGACTGTGTCAVTMNAVKNVTATFTLDVFALNITNAGTGAGTVVSPSSLIGCSTICSYTFFSSWIVDLTAIPNTGSSFTGWSGACTGTGTCTVTMDAVKNVTATFTPITFALTVTKNGTGTGAVSSNPVGIDCGITCTTNFNDGSSVTLTATPANGSVFAGWTGACSGTGTCTVTMSAIRAITATFNTAPVNTFALTVSKAGTGAGLVSSNPVGIDCGSSCSNSFNQNTIVTLTATPTSGSSFAGWGGACTGAATCTVTMDAVKNVTATFTLNTFSLNITKGGTGAGTISSNPTGINCGATCSATFNQDSSIVLTATPSAGSSFTGWTGACSGAGTCTVTMNAAKNVTATFTVNPPVTFALTTTKNGMGTGSVSSNPAGIDCGATCTTNFNDGSIVTLTATPTSGSVFAGWNGACTGTGTCTVTMNAIRAVTATFNTAPVNTFALTVSKVGTGAGSVSSNPAGIDCGSSCTNSFNQNTVVTLTATPASGSSFAGWSGACTGAGTCVVTMDAVKTVTATFTTNAPSTFALTISKNGTGTGSVSSNPSGIDCGATCTANFNSGLSVTLTATPSAVSSFTSWSGACTGATTCTVTMDAIKNVTATFTVNPPVTFALNITKAGTGTGNVSSDPVGIDCGASCSATFNQSSSIVLTATPSAGSSFTGWGGACTGVATCTVTMDAVKNVTASFALIPSSIAVSTATNPPTDKVINKGSIDNAALAFALTLPNGQLTSLTLSVSGTGNDVSDLTSVKVYADINSNGAVDAGEVVVANGKFSADNGSVILTPSTAIALSASGATQFLVVVDVNSSLAVMRVIPVLGGLLMLGLGIRRRRWVGMLGLAVLLSSCGNEPVVTTNTYQLKLESVTVKVGSTTVKVTDLPISGAVLSVQK